MCLRLAGPRDSCRFVHVAEDVSHGGAIWAYLVAASSWGFPKITSGQACPSDINLAILIDV